MPSGNGESTLHDVFPGTTLTLSNGRAVTIEPWSAWDVIHTVPSKIAAIASAVMPVFTRADSATMQARIPSALAVASGALADIVREETGLTDEDLKGLRGVDMARITTAIIEQNMDFFGEIEKIRVLVSDRGPTPTGRTSPPS